MTEERTVTPGELITEKEAKALSLYVKRMRELSNCPPTVHNCVMRWLDMHRNKAILERFAKHGVLKAYGAYLFEYYLKLK